MPRTPLEPEHVEALRAIGSERHYAAGEMVAEAGSPMDRFIYVEDGNHNNRGELLLRHAHEGVDLDLGQAKDTLINLYKVWGRPVSILSKVDGKGKMLRHDDSGYSDKSAEYPAR